MNTPLLPRGGRLLAGVLACTLATASSPAEEIPEAPAPRGTLAVDRDLVQTGIRSQLTWHIEYPAATVARFIEVEPSNSVTAKQDLKMRVRVLGASFQAMTSNNGHGNNADGVDVSNPGEGDGGPNGAIDASGPVDDELKATRCIDLPLELTWSKSGTAWSSLFHGYQSAMDPTKVLLETTLKAGESVNFGGQGWMDGGWLPLRTTGSSSGNVAVLKNGDRVPATVAALNITSIESFLKPYMDTSTKAVIIGDRDLLFLIELDQTDPLRAGFDLQDLVILVTFE